VGLAGPTSLDTFQCGQLSGEVWLNGECLGEHEGGHLPFVFDITSRVRDEGNVLVVRVDGQLRPDRVPPGGLSGLSGATFGRADFPDTNFDFFPFCGIERPVLIYTEPPNAITDLTVTTHIEGSTGRVRVNIAHTPGDALSARVTLTGHGTAIIADVDLTGESAEVTLTVPQAALWSPEAPNLYDLRVELRRGETTIDRYGLPVGIRTIHVDGDRLLLNGQPVRLVGFGRHEDFPVVGRGCCLT
jgi:beta-glucuronidase